MGQLGEGKMTGRGLAGFERLGKLGEEEEKGKSWERGQFLVCFWQMEERVRRLVVKRTVRGSLVCEEEER